MFTGPRGVRHTAGRLPVKSWAATDILIGMVIGAAKAIPVWTGVKPAGAAIVMWKSNTLVSGSWL